MRVRQSNGVRDMVPMNGKPDDFNACVNLSSLDSLNRYPVLFMSGTGKWVLPGDHAKNLKDYVLGGGFVFMDECAAPALEDDFYNSALSCLVNLFENEAVLPVPEDHVIYSNVYDIKSQGFKSFKRPNGVHPDMGVFLDGRLAVYLDNADLHCGWLDPKDTFIKRTLHEEGMQRGLNLFSYFLSYHKPAEI